MANDPCRPSAPAGVTEDGRASEAAARSRPELCGIAAILLVAAAVRLVGVGWGLPDIDVRPDEELTISMALKFGTGDPNPHWFWYPTLFGYLLFLCYGALTVAWMATGVISRPSDLLTVYATDPSAFFLIPRLISALAGTATVGLVYGLGRRLYGPGVGLAAAFVQAVAFLAVRDSHFGTIDPLMILFAMLAMRSALLVFETGTLRSYLLAGMWGGLAASTKYYGVVVLVAPVAAHLLRPRAAEGCRQHRRLVATMAVAAASFLATSPFVLLSFHEFWRDYQNVRKVQGGLADEYLMRAWRYHLVRTLPGGLTPPIYLAGLAGMLGLFLADRRRALVVFAYPLAFFAVIGASYASYSRYVTPIVPFLALAGAWLVVRGTQAIGRAFALGPRACGGLTAGVLALTCAGSIFEDAHLLVLLRGPDTRRLAADWIRAHLDHGATIGWLGSQYGRPPLPQTPESLERRLSGPAQEGHAGVLVRKRIELSRDGAAPRYLVVDVGRDPSRWREALPAYLLVERYPMFYTRRETAFADAWLDRGGYREEMRWRVTDPGREIPGCDPQDALYLPYGLLDRVRHSGPELTLYRRTAAPTPHAGDATERLGRTDQPGPTPESRGDVAQRR